MDVLESLVPWGVMIVFLMFLFGLCKTYEKAGYEAYDMFLPFRYMDLSGLPKIAFLVLLLPFINIIFFIYVSYKVGIRFGMSNRMSALLSMLPFILFLITGFSKKYQYMA
ncbi:MAG: hypothetical protein KUA35_01820 [Pseudodesulfovibrio sp.]|uniref:DUF5684 domain-containing protein n=1 Tax=Pseudodesulfovibrio TaxID=2035811 RepID=UPI0012FF0A13|nr:MULTISPECIES: DUF5684 domain-containing protein [Pseudodesulfovibrio]MBU4191762.1 hypothetical protein [Pseudomonadota bacterium]MBU4244380.1 hypothetical protein [Pseudomonadota bacterium]MBU4379021.1 hypothetical protein [Pseudomonadota bacterium]MBU4473935.1 hypothetical protein [Pseudomonadota bacterium]MBU4515133.1 hypothetical protein [Pseudomonadota bacterium]